ncbi:MAG: hypothetical protein VX185_11255 [Pseudomonadota bacterium]|nr:hypothetical protein [Pseudomonadota bacterium]
MVSSMPAVNGLQSTGIEARFGELDLAANNANPTAKQIAKTVIENMVKDGILAPVKNADNADKPSIHDELQGQLENHLNLILNEHPIDDHKEAVVTKAISQAVRAMADTTYVDMKHMTKNASDELLNIAKQASNFIANPNYHLTLSAVFGGTQDSCRMRAISYALAPLEALDKLLAIKKNMNDVGVHTGKVTMKLLSAHNAAIQMNGYDKSVEKNAKSIFSTVQKYIEATRPHLKGSDAIQYAYDSLKLENEFLDNSFDLAAQAVPNEIVAKLHKMGINHGGEEGANNSVRYGLLHPLVTGDFAVAKPGEINKPLHDTGVVSYGGSPEKRFNDLRKIVTSSLVKHSPRVFVEKHDISRVISTAGERAVYYIATDLKGNKDDTDVSMIHAAEKKPEPEKGYSRLIKKDVALLKNDLAIHVGEQIGVLTADKSKQPEDPVVDRDTNLKKRVDANLSKILPKPKVWDRELKRIKAEYLEKADTNSIFHETNVRTLDALIKNGPFNKVDKVVAAFEAQMYPLLSDILMLPSPNIQPTQSLLP